MRAPWQCECGKRNDGTACAKCGKTRPALGWIRG